MRRRQELCHVGGATAPIDLRVQANLWACFFRWNKLFLVSLYPAGKIDIPLKQQLDMDFFNELLLEQVKFDGIPSHRNIKFHRQ